MKKNIKTIIFCAAALGIMTTIFLLSSQDSTDSANLSRGFINTLFDILPFFSHIDAAQKTKLIKSIHSFIRKTAHFSIYATLGFCLTGMFIQKIQKRKKLIICLISVGVCCLYAISDELHQYFISGRSSEIRDVFIDTCGGMVGASVYMLIYILWHKLLMRKKQKLKEEKL